MPSAGAFLWSKPWRRFRRAFLLKHPICAVPGCRAASAQVDHIVSRARGGAPMDPANCQALCLAHHSLKTRIEDNPSLGKTDRRLKAWGCDADGVPVDPTHPWRT